MQSQNDLFDVPEIWKTDPLKAFDAFIGSIEFVEMGKHGKAKRAEGKEVRPLAASSQTMYRHMFTNFYRWLKNRRLQLNMVDEAVIKEFLEISRGDKSTDGKKLKSLIRVRYLRLLERVYAHLGASPNPATRAAYAVHKSAAAGRDKPKVYLDLQQQLAFLSKLPEPPGFDPEDYNDPSWKKRRDRAMLAMMLGAGLKVSEVINLPIQSFGKKDPNGSLDITVGRALNNGKPIEHWTLLRQDFVLYVLPWIEERKRRGKIPGKLLFPASLKRGEPLNKATVYRHVKATLESAGLDLDRMGGRTLRNSFAVREIKQGADMRMVQEFMGHYERRSTEQYVVEDRQKKLIK